jgi:hypothetical protein
MKFIKIFYYFYYYFELIILFNLERLYNFGFIIKFYYHLQTQFLINII